MGSDTQPLTDDERAELEVLRAEKAAREAQAQAQRERAELEALRAERAAQATPVARQTPAPRQAAAPRRAPETDEDRRIREARAQGAKLMEPGDDLRMPVGQKIVLAVIALLVVLIVGMHFLMG